MLKILIGVLLSVFVLGLAGYFILAPASATPAVLYIEEGTVEVNAGKGWVAGVNEMELKNGAGVRTKEGEATVVFMEGEMLSLQPNTEVRLDKVTPKKVLVSQLAGETWNKITKLSGITEYAISTPSTVATVRGTEFFLNDEELAVGDGEVQYGSHEKQSMVMVRKHKQAVKDKFVEEEMSDEQLAKMKKFPQKYMKVLKNVRAREIRKHKMLVDQLKKKSGMSEAELEKQLEGIDEGAVDEDKLYSKVPGLLQPKAKRAYMLTKEIKKVRQQMKQQQ